MPQKIIIATRQSPLALWQTEKVRHLLLQIDAKLQIEFLPLTTRGDEHKDVALSAIGGKSLFAKELQTAVITKKADIAVHSVKDLAAVTLPELKLAAILEREDPRDVLISANALSFQELPRGAVIGTASPRRRCQLLHLRPDLEIKLLRGNVGTRLAKIANHHYDAIVLAAAGLKRLELQQHVTEYFAAEFLLPAIGQGAIGVECRIDDTDLQRLLAQINHPQTAFAVSSERAVNARLGGNCFTPIAALAKVNNEQLTLTARLGSLDGSRLLASQYAGTIHEAEAIGRLVADDLIQQGGKSLLEQN